MWFFSHISLLFLSLVVYYLRYSLHTHVTLVSLLSGLKTNARLLVFSVLDRKPFTHFKVLCFYSRMVRIPDLPCSLVITPLLLWDQLHLSCMSFLLFSFQYVSIGYQNLLSGRKNRKFFVPFSVEILCFVLSYCIFQPLYPSNYISFLFNLHTVTPSDHVIDYFSSIFYIEEIGIRKYVSRK